MILCCQPSHSSTPLKGLPQVPSTSRNRQFSYHLFNTRLPFGLEIAGMLKISPDAKPPITKVRRIVRFGFDD